MSHPGNNPAYTTPMERILDAARWVPSGGNQQFWRFEKLDERRLVVHVQSLPSIMIVRGEGTWLAVGMLLEAMRIAASHEALSLQWTRLPDGSKEGHYRIEVTFEDAPGIAPHVLYPYLRLRHTDRRHYRATPLSREQEAALEAAMEGYMRIIWHRSVKERLQVARVNMQAFLIRMRSRTAYSELAGELEWQQPFPATKIPVASLPIMPPTYYIMRWALQCWERIGLLARIPGALLPSAVELELVPAMLCGAHFILARPGDFIWAEERVIEEGGALLRFWLTTSRLGLSMQPSYSPISFSHYGHFPQQLPAGEMSLKPSVVRLSQALAALAGVHTQHITFMGRLGTPKNTNIASRSLRMTLEQLWFRKP